MMIMMMMMMMMMVVVDNLESFTFDPSSLSDQITLVASFLQIQILSLALQELRSLTTLEGQLKVSEDVMMEGTWEGAVKLKNNT
jgi:hypothetical protein